MNDPIVASSDYMFVGTTRVDVDAVLEFANAVREAGGANPLDALLPSVPNEPGECLIARNLNFSCEVFPLEAADDLQRYVYRDGSNEVVWHMVVKDDAVRQTIAVRLGLVIDEGFSLDTPVKGIRLPRWLGRVAHTFDVVGTPDDDLYLDEDLVLYDNFENFNELQTLIEKSEMEVTNA